MQLKGSGKGSKPLLAAVVLSAVLAVIAAMSTDFLVLNEDIKQSFLAEDVGLSNVTSLPTALGKLPAIAEGMLFGYDERPEIETVYIDVNPREYRQLLRDRETALKNRILDDPEEVNAKVRFRGEQYRADVRLKGDLMDHWLSQKRMSLRVEMKKDASILGYSRFSIQKPASRQHPYDQIFQALVRRAGNLASAHQYVNVNFNGQPWGIMDMEESMSAEFLEKQQHKESLMVKFSDDERGVYTARLEQAGLPDYASYRLSDEILSTSMYEPGKHAGDPQYRKWLSYIIQERTNFTDTPLYDVDAYSRALFIASYWNDGHPLYYQNARHYFNPYTLKLEPITTDAYIPFDIRTYGGMFPRRQFNPMTTNTIYNYVVGTDEFQADRDANFDAAYQAMTFAAYEQNYWHAFFPLDYEDPNFLTILENNILLLNLDENRDAIFVPQPLEVNREPRPPSDEQARLLPHHVHVRHFDDGRLLVFNLLPDTVHLSGIQLNGETVIPLDQDLPPYQPGNYQPLALQTNLTGQLDDAVAIQTQYRGQTRSSQADLTLVSDYVDNPLGDFSYRPPFLSRMDNGDWEIAAGTWDVEKPLVVPGNLALTAGTTLRFADDAYLVVNGALNAQGSPGQPVTFTARDDTWKGIYVYQAGAQSVWRNVLVEHYTALQDGILSLTGGLTFYRADLELHQVELDGTMAEDAINIVESTFTIDGLTIHDTRSDGLDSDFSSGTISHSSFSAINGDALDFSGSEVDISDFDAAAIYDKGVSVGEGSSITVRDATLSDVGSGIVVKDGSMAEGRHVRVTDYVLAGAMAYQKKSFYGPAALVLDDFSYDGDTPVIRQTGSSLTLEGDEVPPRDVDVDYLYENTVMKK